MKELLRSNDPVRLSWAEALLAAAGIEIVIADRHTSIVEGSIGAIQRRILVAESDFRRARQILADAEPGCISDVPPSADGMEEA
jgi:Putative prokaryotic signal transducing protein